MSIVICEGPDGSGKSTLANMFVEAGFEYRHCGPPEDPAYGHWARLIEAAQGEDVVFDRLHAGGYVYGTAFRGASDLTPHEHWLLEGQLLASPAAIVYACPPANVIDQNLRRGPDNEDAKVYEDATRRSRVRELYDRYFLTEHVNQLPMQFYDYTQHDPNTVVQKMTSFLRRWEEREALFHGVPVLGDHRQADTVLVGEQPHPRAKALQHAKKNGLDPERYIQLLAAVWNQGPRPDAVFDSTSGRYLQQALAGRATLTNTAIVNSIQFDGRTLGDFADLEMLRNRRVVALGKVASRELSRHGVPHRAVPHPQWVRRFHYKEGLTRYGDAVMGTKEWTP